FGAGASVTAGILCTNALPILIPLHSMLLFFQLIRGWKEKESRSQILSLNLFFFIGLLTTLSPFVITHLAEPNAINPQFDLCWLAAFILYLIAVCILLFWSRNLSAAQTVPSRLI